VKRAFDIVVSLAALILVAPLLAVAMLAIWAGDGHVPLYRGWRVGRDGRAFRMLKLRSMMPGAAALGGTHTPTGDPRITTVGRHLRRLKLDELPQLINVLMGDMSLVGPRPNTRCHGVDRYTPAEMRLLSVRPGITDLASIVFFDEGDLLDGASDPDARHDAVVRPWKSRLGLLYVAHRSFADDLRLLGLTALAIVAKPAALRGAERVLTRWTSDETLRRVCCRREPLPFGAPPDVAVS